MNKAPEHILIVLFGAIGDVVRALPLAGRIRQTSPSTKISWAIEPKSKGILLDHPFVDRLVVFERGGGLSAYRSFIRELRSEKYDITLDLQRHLKSGFTSYLSRSKTRVGFHRKDAKEFNWLWNNNTIPKQDSTLPKIDHYQKFADAIGVPEIAGLDFGFHFSDEEIERAEQLFLDAAHGRIESDVEPEKRLGLIIGASWQSKIWPHERYVQLIRGAHQRFGMTSYLIGGPAESITASRILNSLGEVPGFSLVGKCTLRELACVLSQTGIVAGSDSGPMHIAAAVGAPVVSLWGATDPVRTGPYGSENLVLQSAIGCAPCYKRKCPGLDNLCMSDIPSDAVLARIQSIFGRSPSI